MKTFITCLVAASVILLTLPSLKTADAPKSGWVSLFDGKTLNGWKISEHPETFSVKDGAIVVHGERAHLFYEGDVNNHNFKNYEFKATVMTRTPSGIDKSFLVYRNIVVKHYFPIDLREERCDLLIVDKVN